MVLQRFSATIRATKFAMHVIFNSKVPPKVHSCAIFVAVFVASLLKTTMIRDAFFHRKESYIWSLQEDLRAAPKQEFVSRLETELKEAREQLQAKAESLRRCVCI